MSASVETTVKIETKFGPGEVITFKGLKDDEEHMAMGFGRWREAPVTNVRVHSECLTGDVFGSKRCDCGPQLQEAIERFTRTQGVLIYLRQEGRGIGLRNKMKAYQLQDQGMDTYEANRRLGFEGDARDFTPAAEMLKALSITKICLLSNNPLKAQSLSQNGIEIVRRIFTQTFLQTHNERYLRSKQTHGGHDGLDLPLTKRE